MANKVKGKVRLGLIGCGGISAGHMRGVLEHANKIRAVALADINERSLGARDEQLGGGLAKFTDWRKMLREMKDEIDAVDICLPHHLHKAAIVDAARAGKHILCEKPLCLNLHEAAEIGRVLKRTRVTYMSGHNQLFLPFLRTVKQMIESKRLGRIFWIRSQDCFMLRTTPKRMGWRANVVTQGGGELIDTGYHPTYRLLYLAGSKPAAVRATFGQYSLKLDAEDTAAVQVRFENGIIGEIFTSWAFRLPHGTHQVHVIGEKGEVFGSGTNLYYRPDGFEEPARMTFPQVASFTAQIEHFADCLRTGKRPIHGFEEGRDVLKVILDAAESAKGWEKG